MADVTEIYVELATGPGSYSATDDHVYVGVCGTKGGREFALDVHGFDDWEENSKVSYQFGSANYAISPGDYGPVRDPATAGDQLENIRISQPDVTHVYLRKQGDRTPRGDDFWELTDSKVLLMSGDSTRIFTLRDTVRLGNEYGHNVWLTD